MEPCTLYQKNHHLLMVATSTQQDVLGLNLRSNINIEQIVSLSKYIKQALTLE